MYGLGTIVNVAAIIIGGLLGLLEGTFLKKRFQDMMIFACGMSTVFIGIGGTMEKMLQVGEKGLSSGGSMMLIASLVVGGLLGELLRIEDHLEQFGEWLKQKTGNAGDASFVNGFVVASFTVCIGAMAVVGSIEDGIYANHAILFTKSVLDFIIVMIMASSMGKGCIFSAISVGAFQGLITLCAGAIKPIMTAAALSNLSFVGSVMIFCVGLNLVTGVLAEDTIKKVKVGNLLPGLIIAVLWAFSPWQ